MPVYMQGRLAHPRRRRYAAFVRRIVSAFALVGALAGALSACAGPGAIVARNGAQRLVANDAPSGLAVVLTTGSWPGSNWVYDEFSVVHVLVSNLGPEPILLAPGDFELVDKRGFRYRLYDTGARFRRAEDPDQPHDLGRPGSVRNINDGELARVALPWGVLQPGTQMRGFLYFDESAERANLLNLRWHAQTPRHQQVAQFEFPLAVARPPA